MVARSVSCLFLLLAALVLPGCQLGRTRITVRGGPSLDALFADLIAAYEQRNPDVTVTADFTCPPCVLFQRPGALTSFDLFASLGQFELDRLTQTGQIPFDGASEIGRTTLSLVTSTHVPTDIRTIADLHKPESGRIGVGDPEQVGVGYYAREALTKAGLWDELKPRFEYTKSGCELLKYLALGRDIDSAIVFSLCTGEEHASIRSVIEFPRDLAPPVPLLLAIATESTHKPEAQAFIDFARSPENRPLYEKHKVLPRAAPVKSP